MDDPEREGMLQYIRELERSARRWRAIATIALAVLAVFFLAVVIGGGTIGALTATRARQAEMIAREQAEVARQEAEAARAHAERVAAEQHKQSEEAKKGKGKD
jgi:hypothetical protein